MTTTTRSIISGALRLAGVSQYGQAPNDEEISIGIENLRNLTDIWSTNPQLVWNRVTSSFTVGITDFAVTLPSRPVAIQSVTFEVSTDATYSAVVFQLLAMDEMSYQQTPVRHTGLPRAYMWDHNKTINLIGASNGTIFVVWQPTIDDLTTNLDAELALLPGYEIAIKSGLAVMLCEEFGKAPSASLTEMASTSVSAIKAQNKRPAVTKTEAGLITGNRGAGIIPRGQSIV